MSNSIHLEGLGLAGYRSFGRELQRIGPCSKVNLIIGQNNSGKSNVLRFLAEQYPKAILAARAQNAGWRLENRLDHHIGAQGLAVSFGIRIAGPQYVEFLKAQEDDTRHRIPVPLLERVMRSRALTKGTDVAWFTYSAVNGQPLALKSETVDEIVQEAVLASDEWFELWAPLTSQSGGSLQQHWIPETLHRISPVHHAPPTIRMIPAVRQVLHAQGTDEDLSGTGLIHRLARLQNPAIHEREALTRFREITDFVREVVGNRSAKIEIPHERDMIMVEMDGKLLPLEHLGTGIHEVIILAAAATVVREQVLCIEEPELHLHPSLQRKLISYLQEHTSNQYFITTHSAHLLDTAGASVFHIRHDETSSRVDVAYTSKQRADVCADLGYRASDLLQANSIVWVEGPSDRIYLNHWLQSEAPDLVEGLHYSVMFYGGRLLSHLTADDPEVSDSISLRRLNRYIAILIDSDRSAPRAHLNATKKRLRAEFDAGPGFAWITAGREIENYVPAATLETVVKEVYPRANRMAGTGPFDHPLPFFTARGEFVDRVDKIKVAHQVASRPASLGVLDLQEKIRKLVSFIREANRTDLL